MGIVRRFAATAVMLFAAVAASAAYPERAVKIVIGVPPGGASDAAARLLAESLAKAMGRPFIVENKPGAGGALAAQAVYAAPADGYTLLWVQSSMAGLPKLLKSPPFKSLSEFTPVSLTCRLPAALYVHPGVPAADVAQLVQYARAHPDALNYATGPLSEYMAAVQFMKATGTSMVRVPYKGGAPAITDLLEGRVQVYFTPIAQGLPHAQAGKLRMLATLMPARSTQAPNVPTMKEAGVGDLPVPNWNAIMAPPGTSRAVVDRLARELAVQLEQPAMRAALERLYLIPESSTPRQLGEMAAESAEAWQRFIEENAIPAE